MLASFAKHDHYKPLGNTRKLVVGRLSRAMALALLQCKRRLGPLGCFLVVKPGRVHNQHPSLVYV